MRSPHLPHCEQQTLVDLEISSDHANLLDKTCHRDGQTMVLSNVLKMQRGDRQDRCPHPPGRWGNVHLFITLVKLLMEYIGLLSTTFDEVIKSIRLGDLNRTVAL